MTMRDILATCGTISGSGTLTVTFSEGTFSFKDGVELARPNLVFRGQGHATILEREAVATGHSLTSLWLLSGEGIVVEGFRVKDSTGTGAAFKVTGDRCVVRDCVFEDCFLAVELNGSEGSRVVDNHVYEIRDTDYAIRVTNGSSDGVVSGCVVEPSGITASIYFDDATLRFAIVGNQTFPGGEISYRGADLHVAAGNPGTVTVR
jgi:hypothetical protein